MIEVESNVSDKNLRLISTGRELLPIFTQSSLKLGLVRIYTKPCSVVVIKTL